LKKKRHGASLRVVYITDGRQSHARYMPWEELSARRAREAEAAMGRLGVEKGELTFLGFPDGDLAAHFQAAVERVAALLREVQPRQVFMPFRQDPQPAHLAASAIVTAALRRSGSPAAVFEYPVWYWDHWPWVALKIPSRPPARRTLKNTLRFALGLRLLSAFNRSLDTRDVLEDKCAALDCYETQVRRPPEIPAWPVLGEVSAGEWLACFLREREIFRSAA
jgi:LmbE family N-acetylglucosaminyl deacetylase